MKAYKATANMTCKSLTYEVGKTYTFNGPLKLCQTGFHFCEDPKNTSIFYIWNENFVLLEIEVLGEVISKATKSVTNKLKVIRVVPRQEAATLLDIVEEYDDKGRVIHFASKGVEDWKTPTEYWRKYDDKGNEIYYRNGNIEWWKQFDDDKNMIYHKDATMEKHISITKRGKTVHCVFPNGVEFWKDYNLNGKVIHYKDNNGIETWTEYTPDGKLMSEKRTANGLVIIETTHTYDSQGNLISYKDEAGNPCSITISD